MRELRNRTTEVLDAVRGGETVVLTVHGQKVADIVPHHERRPWLSGALLASALVDHSADPGLRGDLDELAGQTVADL